MRKLKRLAAIFLVLIFAPVVMGMGTGDSEGPTRIPDPQADYKVLLTDQTGARVELSKFAIDGMAFMLGDLGQGQAAIPFDKVKEVVFSHANGKLSAQINLTKGEPVKLLVKPSLKATGQTSYGNYRIALEEVSRIEVLGLN